MYVYCRPSECPATNIVFDYRRLGRIPGILGSASSLCPPVSNVSKFIPSPLSPHPPHRIPLRLILRRLWFFLRPIQIQSPAPSSTTSADHPAAQSFRQSVIPTKNKPPSLPYLLAYGRGKLFAPSLGVGFGGQGLRRGCIHAYIGMVWCRPHIPGFLFVINILSISPVTVLFRSVSLG